jgi:hypothetical protein
VALAVGQRAAVVSHGLSLWSWPEVGRRSVGLPRHWALRVLPLGGVVTARGQRGGPLRWGWSAWSSYQVKVAHCRIDRRTGLTQLTKAADRPPTQSRSVALGPVQPADIRRRVHVGVFLLADPSWPQKRRRPGHHPASRHGSSTPLSTRGRGRSEA